MEVYDIIPSSQFSEIGIVSVPSDHVMVAGWVYRLNY